MKLFTKLLIFILILLSISLVFIKGSNGLPLLTSNIVHSSKIPSFNALINKTTQFFSTEPKSHSPESFQVYKWKDKKGVVHYSDKNDPDKKGKLTELKKITILPVNKKKFSVKSADSETEFASKIPSITTIPLPEIPKLINNAKQAKKIMEERKDNLDRVLDAH